MITGSVIGATLLVHHEFVGLLFGLKGRNMSAQGNALGNCGEPQRPALKGNAVKHFENAVEAAFFDALRFLVTMPAELRTCDRIVKTV